jgi:uncharacterized RDD family membrane protein YckC
MRGSGSGWWSRLIDSVILGIPFSLLFGVIAVAAGVFAGNTGSTNQNTQGAAAAVFGGFFILLYLFFVVITIGYWIYFWGTSGATLGMRLLRLRVIDANTGGAIGYARAVVRLLMTVVNTWACYIGWIWVAFDPRKQGWHDKVANSVVIHYWPHDRGRALAGPLREALAQPVDDVLERGARREQLRHALFLQGGDVVLRDDAATEHDDVGRLASLQLLHDGWEQCHVRARVDREPDHLGVLLERSVDDHLRRLAQARVDDLVARVA